MFCFDRGPSVPSALTRRSTSRRMSCAPHPRHRDAAAHARRNRAFDSGALHSVRESAAEEAPSGESGASAAPSSR
jgi:hypothetical protein